MTKMQFLLTLNDKLSCLPRNEVEERLNFYSEMIEDRMEEGLSEEEAVAAVGSAQEIAAQILGETKPATEKTTQKRALKAWEILLLVLGAPLWISLVVAAAAVIVSVYISLWAVVISLWAVFGSFIGCSLGGLLAGVTFICTGNTAWAVMYIGAAVLLAGLSIFTFFGCKAATKGAAILGKKLVLWVKGCFVKKEASV